MLRGAGFCGRLSSGDTDVAASERVAAAISDRVRGAATPAVAVTELATTDVTTSATTAARVMTRARH